MTTTSHGLSAREYLPSILAVLLVAGIVAGVAVVDARTTQPLAAYPVEAGLLDGQAASVSMWTDSAASDLALIQGTDVTLATEGTAADQAYANTFLDADHETVTDLDDAIATCETILDLAAEYQDETRTVIGRKADDTGTPVVVTLDQVDDVTVALDDCKTRLNTSAAWTAVRQARTVAALDAAAGDNITARAALQAAIDAASTTLAGSDGKVTDTTVRDSLQTAITQATDALNATMPTDLYTHIDVQTADLTALIDPLTTSSQAVVDSQTSWQAAQDAAAAAAAAAASSKTSSSTKKTTTSTSSKTGATSSTKTSTSSSSGTTGNSDGSSYGPPKTSTYDPGPYVPGCVIIEGSTICH